MHGNVLLLLMINERNVRLYYLINERNGSCTFYLERKRDRNEWIGMSREYPEKKSVLKALLWHLVREPKREKK